MPTQQEIEAGRKAYQGFSSGLSVPDGQYVYNYNTGGLTPEQFRQLAMRDPELASQYQFAQFSDPNSQYYQNLRKEISSTLADVSPTLGTLLGFQRAAGVSGEVGGRIASEQREATERAVAEETGSQVRQAQTQGAQFGTQGLFNIAQLREQRRQFEESQPGFFEQIAPVVGGVLGLLNPFGDGDSGQSSYTPRPQATGINRVATNTAGFFDPQANTNEFGFLQRRF